MAKLLAQTRCAPFASRGAVGKAPAGSHQVLQAQRRPAGRGFLDFDDKDDDFAPNLQQLPPADPKASMFLQEYRQRTSNRPQGLSSMDDRDSRRSMDDGDGRRSMDDRDNFMDEREDRFRERERRNDKPREQVKRYVNGKQILINEEFSYPELRLFGAEKEPLGIVKYDMALNMAINSELDLVLMDNTQDPPIARLVVWSKYKFEVEKTGKQKKSGSAVQELKEIRMRPKTDDNDVSTKLKSAHKFLSKGNKVKLTMRFEGREMQFRDLGKETLLKFIAGVADVGKVDGLLNFKTGTYTVILSPK